MTLFAHRFLTSPESAHMPPGRYDETRAVRVDEAGRPVVSADATTTRAEIDRPHVATFGIVTKAEIDRPHVAAFGVTNADTDRDPCSSKNASNARIRGSPVMLLTKTAGGIDEDEDREPSWQRAARRVSQATP